MFFTEGRRFNRRVGTQGDGCSGRHVDVLSAVNDGDSLLRQQLALLITSVDSCCWFGAGFLDRPEFT